MREDHQDVMPNAFLQEQEQQGASSAPAHSILDSLLLSIAVLDADGTITAVNQTWRRMALESCPPDRLARTGVGVNYLQICQNAHGLSAEGALDAFVGIAAVLSGTQSSFALEYPCFSPTRQSWYLMQVTPLAQQRGAIVAHLDITERKHAEEALQEANRRFAAFLSLASHELKTPLTGISGSIQLVLRRLGKLAGEQMAHGLPRAIIDRLRHPLEEALQRVSVQDRMITELLDVSRIQADRLEMQMASCDLAEIVHRAVADVQYLAPDRTIAVSCPAEQSIPILADADRIGQVVSNYLGNALKYSAADRPVELRLVREGATARVCVKDHGPGLTLQEQQVIWERFSRVTSVPVQYGTGAGLGLGLYLCRTIIQRHAGQVGVESSKEQGATFWFTLPLAPAP